MKDILSVTIILLAIPHSGCAQTIIDSVCTYCHHIVGNHVIVRGSDTLSVSDVTVISGGKLTLSSPRAVVIPGGFQVKQGGVLSVETNRDYRIRYTYDTAGNRTRRENE